MTDELETSLKESLKNPKRAKGDSAEIEQHSLRDQIAAAKYLASQNAVKKGLGAIFKKLIPPGTD